MFEQLRVRVVKRGHEVWGDTGRVALVPVNTDTCKTTHTHTHTSAGSDHPNYAEIPYLLCWTCLVNPHLMNISCNIYLFIYLLCFASHLPPLHKQWDAQASPLPAYCRIEYNESIKFIARFEVVIPPFGV
jgi:hypothetical protein